MRLPALAFPSADYVNCARPFTVRVGVILSRSSCETPDRVSVRHNQLCRWRRCHSNRRATSPRWPVGCRRASHVGRVAPVLGKLRIAHLAQACAYRREVRVRRTGPASLIAIEGFAVHFLSRHTFIFTRRKRDRPARAKMKKVKAYGAMAARPIPRDHSRANQPSPRSGLGNISTAWIPFVGAQEIQEILLLRDQNRSLIQDGCGVESRESATGEAARQTPAARMTTITAE